MSIIFQFLFFSFLPFPYIPTILQSIKSTACVFAKNDTSCMKCRIRKLFFNFNNDHHQDYMISSFSFFIPEGPSYWLLLFSRKITSAAHILGRKQQTGAKIIFCEDKQKRSYTNQVYRRPIFYSDLRHTCS